MHKSPPINDQCHIYLSAKNLTKLFFVAWKVMMALAWLTEVLCQCRLLPRGGRVADVLGSLKVAWQRQANICYFELIKPIILIIWISIQEARAQIGIFTFGLQKWTPQIIISFSYPMWFLVLYPTIFDSGLVLWGWWGFRGLGGDNMFVPADAALFQRCSLALAPPWASSLSRP